MFMIPLQPSGDPRGDFVDRIEGDWVTVVGKPGCFRRRLFDEGFLGQVVQLYSPHGSMSRFYEE